MMPMRVYESDMNMRYDGKGSGRTETRILVYEKL